MMNKTCSTCQKTQDISNFNSNRTRPDGLHHQCRSCHANYYLKIKEYRRDKVFEQRRTRKENAIKYLGGACVDCGYNANIDGFQFDHLPEHGKPDRSSLQLLNSWSRIIQELNKCELVCGTCPAIRTSQRRRI